MYIPDLRVLINDAKSFFVDLDREMTTVYDEDLNVYVFRQTWGSTALGFPGIGGQVLTSAYTTVIHDIVSNYVVVYFGEGVAYVLPMNEKVYKCIMNHEFPSVVRSGNLK